MLNFNRRGLYAIDFFVQGLKKPIAVASYSLEENERLQKIREVMPYNEINLTRWCRQNGYKFQVL